MKKRICYFGILKEDFTRTRVIKMALEAQGFEVIFCTDHTPSLKKYFYLIKKHYQIKNDYDLILVGFPGYFTVLLARLITFKPIIYDAYISYYDGLTDRRQYPSWHPRLFYGRMIDFLSSRSANITLVINEETKKFFIKKLKAPSSRMEVLHKGADETIFYPRRVDSYEEKEIYRVTWWGTYIPLHGIHYIIEAAELLKIKKNIKFFLIGNGQLKEEVEQQIKNLNLDNVSLLGSLPKEELIKEIDKADIALGIFNNSPKALRCVTNKVYEAMAMGKAIITERSSASQEVLRDKINAYLVEPGNAKALAIGISDLVQDTKLRNTLSKNAFLNFNEHFTSKMIGEEFADILIKHNILFT